PAAFEMEEILYELRDHSAGLNAGRWDYMFSVIKTFRTRGEEFLLPDRNSVTMTVPFMRAYTELLVRTCHKRGAHAIGGMAAFIPSKDPAVNEQAFARVRAAKEREANDGFDGSWVAHPGMVELCKEVFTAVLGDRPNQIDKKREDVQVAAEQLLDVRSTPGEITEAGLRSNISVGIQYIESWLRGSGAVGINNLMEDAATAIAEPVVSDRTAALAERLRSAVGVERVLTDRSQVRTYECDGLANFKVTPAIVVLAESRQHVVDTVRLCSEAGVPFVARGSGTGLSGGALPSADGVLLVLSRLRKLSPVDADNRQVTVEPGVINLWVTRDAAPHDLAYAPDPSSQLVCSIGGDGDALAIEAAEAAVSCGYPAGAVAVLVIELDGPQVEVEAQFRQVEEIARARNAFEIRIAADDAERALMWKGRKSAFAAVGRISPSYFVQDGVIPRTKLPEVLADIERMADERGLRVANVFHAGDGNLHPLVLFDDAVEGQAHEAEELAGAILELCITSGGSITGEHGVGQEKRMKMGKQFTAEDLDTMQLLRCAFDPEGIANPGKVFPTPRLCGERPGVAEDPVGGVVPREVVRPASVEEVSDVLRAAAADRSTVVPVGGRSKLSW